MEMGIRNVTLEIDLCGKEIKFTQNEKGDLSILIGFFITEGSDIDIDFELNKDEIKMLKCYLNTMFRD
jgi:hypothetical protein